MIIANKNKQTKLKEDEVIALYKKGSGGVVVGRYESVNDIVDTERVFNPKFSGASVYFVLSGHKKSFTSLNHQCKVIAKIIKRA